MNGVSCAQRWFMRRAVRPRVHKCVGIVVGRRPWAKCVMPNILLNRTSVRMRKHKIWTNKQYPSWAFEILYSTTNARTSRLCSVDCVDCVLTSSGLPGIAGMDNVLNEYAPYRPVFSIHASY